MTTNKTTLTRAAASALIAATVVFSGIRVAEAGPLPVDLTMKNAAIGHVTDVRYVHRYRRHYYRGGAAFAGIVMGLIGAAIANQYAYPPAYYGNPYGPDYYYGGYPGYYESYPAPYYGGGGYYGGAHFAHPGFRHFSGAGHPGHHHH